MTTEEKQLLLKDLCARLPYVVFINTTKGDGTLDTIQVCCNNDVICSSEKGHEIIDCVKPYLRPMSSMTEEEKKIMRSCGFELIPYDTGIIGFANTENYIDEVSFRFMDEFLNSHHFDYRGLIPMGLALEAKEGMYKIE